MNQLQIDIIMAALDNASILTSWEYDFIISLADKNEEFTESYELSEAQARVLSTLQTKLEDVNVL